MSRPCRHCGTKFPKKSKTCPGCGRTSSIFDPISSNRLFKKVTDSFENEDDSKPCPIRKYFIAAFLLLITGYALFFAYFAYCGVFDKPYEFAADSGSLTDVPEKPEKKSASSGQYSFGDTYELGKWPQENKEPEALHWKVLEEENGVLLLISSHIIASKRYNDTKVDVTWESCSLRKWLNEDFYNSAFSDEEKNRIVVSDNFEI